MTGQGWLSGSTLVDRTQQRTGPGTSDRRAWADRDIVNITIGAGIFVLPALVARDLGSAAPLAYLACGLAMTFVVASFAMAGSRVSLTGGIYAYVEVAFGPLVGFLTGFLVWLSCLLAAASVASALAASVALVVAGLRPAHLQGARPRPGVRHVAWVNVRGVAIGARLVEVITVDQTAAAACAGPPSGSCG